MTLSELMTPVRKSHWRRVGQAVIGTCMVIMLVVTSGATGYWIRDNIAQQRRIEQRKDHLAEIQRLTDAYRRDVKDLGTTTAAASAAVRESAQAVEEASTTASKAAVVASTAAQQSKSAAQQANKAAAAVTQIDKVPEPTRQQINRRVDDINKRVQQ